MYSRKIQRLKNYNQQGNIIINIYNSRLLKNLLGDDQYKQKSFNNNIKKSQQKGLRRIL